YFYLKKYFIVRLEEIINGIRKIENKEFFPFKTKTNDDFDEVADELNNLTKIVDNSFKEIEKLNEYLQRIINTVPVRIFWKDREGKYLGANALFIKDAKLNSLDELLGKDDFERVKKAYDELKIEVDLFPFSKELALKMSKADFAVSRAGASTLWELCANALPTLFIPYPHAAGDHQYYNAKFIVEHELGWCEREADDLKSKLLNAIEVSDLKTKSQKLIEYNKTDVAASMIKELEESLNA
ncbi:MAG: glycosyltransferase, partial [Sulfurimonas sp.]